MGEAVCGLYVHDGWIVIALSFLVLFVASVAIWWRRKPDMSLGQFLYHVFNNRERISTSDPEARARFADPAVGVALKIGVAIIVFNFAVLAACPGSIFYTK
ncbi:hypothetical protein GXW78_14900 [Roseomonas terrae]|uniref:Uncharacterized protein n=1 Tax=Neoroseomonas terrae TaxID=424799 RepID=A0ABS5EIV1_9PROT|nr:hypothetical protein [Neoroseomonas terrae]MBR0650959.1 hypothetical protein [Neoroseomonas terrae]